VVRGNRPAIAGVADRDTAAINQLLSYAKGTPDQWKPIPWVRIHKLAGFVYFPHKRHVQVGLPCQTCHGPVETMTTVGAETGPRLSNDLLHLVGLKPSAPLLTMGWCVECHRRENATRRAQAPLDCVSCHH